MTKKENWLRLLKNDNPGWIGTPWEAFKGQIMGSFVVDPISAAVRKVVPGEFLDQFGVTWKLVEDHDHPNPYITDENKAIKNIKNWKDDLILPPLTGHDWNFAIDFVNSIDREKHLVGSMITGGLFERSHYLMGFQDALVNYMLEPDTMSELLGAITEWKIEHIKQVIDNLRPDVILYHDDWGNKDNLFLPPDTWRQIIKPHQKRIVDSVKSRGVIYLHHSDSICEPIVEDMVELGIDGWQGVIPQNDIPAIQKTLNGRMALIGGIDAQIIDMPEANEKNIRDEVRRCIDEYCPNGYFIPCIPNIAPMYEDVAAIYNDELINYGKDFFKK